MFELLGQKRATFQCKKMQLTSNNNVRKNA